jgi:hypothetical protein
VFLTFGNNDAYVHDSAIFQEDKQAYYSFLYNLWFQNHPANRRFATPELQRTFMDGGYYRVNFDANVSILAYNSMESSSDQDKTQIGPEKQNAFNWLNSALTDSSS